MKLAPVFLWLLAIFIPVMIGRNIYLATFQRQKEEMAATGRHQLMTRVRELEARLTPERIITRQLQLDACNLAYNQIIYTDDPSKLAPIPLVKALPNLSGNGKDLASFSSYLMHKHGIRPAFIVGLHPDPDRCGLFLGDGNELSPAKHALYLREFAEMCNFLNKRSTFFPDVPTEFNTFERFSFFSDYLGIFDHISTNFWRLHGSFSGRYRERLYVINMRPPLPKGYGHHILVGILTSQISPQFALTSASHELSDNEIKVTWGKSEIKELPFFYEESGQLSMLMRLPETFRASLKRPEAADHAGNTAIRLSLNSGDLTKNFLKHASLINLALLIFLSLTLLTAIGTSLGQLKLRSNLSRLITAAFFVSMFLPLSGLAWLGASNARTSRETESEYIIKLTRQKLQQCETAFLLQRYRQQLLMFYMSKVIASLSPGRWGEYTNRFFFNDKYSPFKAHFNNFYLYSAELDREYYRGQNPKERFRTNELPQVMSGAFRRALLQTGAFSHLSEKGRQKMSQLADFSSGIMDELVDDTFFNKVLSTPAELNNATLIARKDLLSVFFLRSPQKVWACSA
ncbi:MAG: hypothetical protein PHD82_04075 [Candidatus Riflebacteria bacterium]|nr:hypothetical protein [Candidatus Riflebacteria bacterium]